MTIRVTAASVLLAWVPAVSVHGQETPPTAQSTTGPRTDQSLAESLHNPFEDFVKIPIHSTIGFDGDGHHVAGEGLNIAPLLPVPLNARWDLIAEPSLSAIFLPSPHEHVGLGTCRRHFF